MISVICSVKNRKKSLKISLISWLMSENISEIVIVDWSSDEEIDDLCNIDNRIKIIRVNNQKHFNVAYSFNLAVDFATNEYIMKMDSDYVLNPYYDFIKICKLENNTFVCGNYKINNSPFFKYLNGFLFVKKEDFLQINGYNENLESCYGWDDDDIFDRFQCKGLIRKNLPHNPEVIFHIPHSDEIRVLNYENKSIYSGIENNKKIAKEQEYNERKYTWFFEKIRERYFRARPREMYRNKFIPFFKS